MASISFRFTDSDQTKIGSISYNPWTSSPWKIVEDFFVSYEAANRNARRRYEAYADVGSADLGGCGISDSVNFPKEEFDKLVSSLSFVGIPFEEVERILPKALEYCCKDLLVILAETPTCQNLPRETLVKIATGETSYLQEYFLAATGRFPEFPKDSELIRSIEKAMDKDNKEGFLKLTSSGDEDENLNFSIQDLDVLVSKMTWRIDFLNLFVRQPIFQHVSQESISRLFESLCNHYHEWNTINDIVLILKQVLSHPHFSPEPAIFENCLLRSIFKFEIFRAFMDSDRVQQFPSEIFGRVLLEIVNCSENNRELFQGMMNHPHFLSKVSQLDFVKAYEACLSRHFPFEETALCCNFEHIRLRENNDHIKKLLGRLYQSEIIHLIQLARSRAGEIYRREAICRVVAEILSKSEEENLFGVKVKDVEDFLLCIQEKLLKELSEASIHSISEEGLRKIFEEAMGKYLSLLERENRVHPCLRALTATAQWKVWWEVEQEKEAAAQKAAECSCVIL